MTEEDLQELYVISVPKGRWLIRLDERPGPRPIMAYGMENCVFMIWSDGSHTTEDVDAVFPALNWRLLEE